MQAARVDVWIWVLVYAGLILVGLGLAVSRSDGALGWGIALAGLVFATAGAVLVWIRSRMDDKT
jgi:hypothetical protein